MEEQRRQQIAYLGYEVKEHGCGVLEDLGQIATEVKIVLPVSHNALASAAEEYVQ